MVHPIGRFDTLSVRDVPAFRIQSVHLVKKKEFEADDE